MDASAKCLEKAAKAEAMALAGEAASGPVPRAGPAESSGSPEFWRHRGLKYLERCDCRLRTADPLLPHCRPHPIPALITPLSSPHSHHSIPIPIPTPSTPHSPSCPTPPQPTRQPHLTLFARPLPSYAYLLLFSGYALLTAKGGFSLTFTEWMKKHWVFKRLIRELVLS